MELLININLIDQYTTSFVKALIDYTPRLVAAVLLLVLGIWAIRIINTVSRKIMERFGYEKLNRKDVYLFVQKSKDQLAV